MDFIPFLREPTLLDKAWMALQYPYDLISSPFSAILSIPTLSFFVIPAFSSYSTTINFLFFYLTWAVLIRTNNPLAVEIIGALGIRLIFYILPSLGFLFFDSMSPSLAVGIKEHGRRALPLGDAQGGLRGGWWKIALVSLLNVLLGVTLQLAIELLSIRVLHIRSALRASTTPPFPWSIVKDIVLGLLLREMLTYYFHRFLLHARNSRLERWHLAWQHSIAAPFSLVAHYDHPLPYLAHVWLPMFLPAVVLRMHLLTYNLYLVLVSLEEVFAYSGYNVLPSAFILGGIARRQERHLMGEANGNYGCLGVVDFFLGTSVGGDLVEDVIDEAEEKQVAQKAKKKIKSFAPKAEQNSDESEPAGEEEAEQQQEKQAAEHKPRARRAKRAVTSGRTDSGEGVGSASSGLKAERARSRKSKKDSDREEDIGKDGEDNVDKPKRKASAAGKASRKTSSKVKQSDKDGEA